MSSLTLNKRLTSLEAARPQAPTRHSPVELEEAARLYADSLEAPFPPDPACDAYFSMRSLKGLATDYDAMLKGASAPWL